MDMRRSTKDQQQQSLPPQNLHKAMQIAECRCTALRSAIHRRPLAVVRDAPQTTRVVGSTLTNPFNHTIRQSMRNSRHLQLQFQLVKSVLIPQSRHQKQRPLSITLSRPSTNSHKDFPSRQSFVTPRSSDHSPRNEASRPKSNGSPISNETPLYPLPTACPRLLGAYSMDDSRKCRYSHKNPLVFCARAGRRSHIACVASMRRKSIDSA